MRGRMAPYWRLLLASVARRERHHGHLVRNRMMSTKRALLIHNPGAGGGGLHFQVSEAASVFQQHGWKIEWCDTECVDDAARFARQAVQNGVHTVLVAGGDGTISRSADGMLVESARRGDPPPTLGILPCGTGNVLARQLGLPYQAVWRPNGLRESAEMLIHGRQRLADVGRINGRHFLCWVGVGIDAQIAASVEEQPDMKRLLGPGIFPLAAMPTLRGPLGTHAHVVVDGRRISRRLILAVISNIRLYAGFFQIAPEAKIDDGKLDVSCFHGQTISTVAHLMLMVILGRHTSDRMATYHQASRVEIRTRYPLPLHADAEPFGMTPAVIETVPQALNLMVPAKLHAPIFSQS